MADLYKDCYDCGGECINVQFCSEGASYDLNEDKGLSLPKHIKFKILANQEFWGFSGVLIEGLSVFEKGYYDYFDGFDLDHKATKQCGVNQPLQGPFYNEQRPDVTYRSVYDATGIKHYNGASIDNIERGGAEVFLIDRTPTSTTDEESCDTQNPLQIFKKSPEQYGFAPKILFSDKIYKNITGAWRYISLNSCYDTLYTDDSICVDCSGNPKQDIQYGDTFAEKYDFAQIRPGVRNSCVQDGSIANAYAGTFYESGLYYSSGESPFVSCKLTYDGAAASGLNNGMLLYFSDVSGEYNNAYRIFDVSHESNYTKARLVGQLGESDFIYDVPSGVWAAVNTYDPETCCGGAVYGVSNETKRKTNQQYPHIDFGRVFNNNKNKHQSNRLPENRYTYDMSTVSQVVDSGRYDTAYPFINESGSVVVDGSGYPVFGRKLPYYGPFYEVDKYDVNTRNFTYNTTNYKNNTCYSKHASLEVYPDCITQYLNYTDCDEIDRYTINRLSRLAFVYRGCDYNDPCEFNSSGNPYFAPTGIEDLKRGLAGQEIYMYVNLSDARGKAVIIEPCPACDVPGTLEPVFVTVKPPVTFPNFPKYDLYPESYGCRDPLWQMKYAVECEGSGYPTCTMPSSQYACNLRQPYTTYGFIRNLCGKESDDRFEVIRNGFSQLVQNGEYRNVNTSGENIPMYWEFNHPYIHESGGYSDNILTPSGNHPFWGLADDAGRLVAPYFHTTEVYYSGACAEETYLDFNICKTRASGWPTDKVPFLIEIDHDDACVGCGSLKMDTNNLVLTLEGLGTEYSHAPTQKIGDYDVATNKYGFNNCRYKGVSFDPTYTCESGFNRACSGEDSYQYNEPYIGDTCSCIDTDIVLQSHKLKGTNMPIGWSSVGPGNNSFVQLPNACFGDLQNDTLLTLPYGQGIFGYSVYGSFKLACANMHDYIDDFDLASCIYWNEIGNPLDVLYNGGSCSHHYPSAESDLKLEARFALVQNGFESLFETIQDKCLTSTAYPSLFGQFEDVEFFSDIIAYLLSSRAYGCPMYLIEYGCWSSGEYGEGFAGAYGDGCVGCPSPATLTCDCPGIACDECGSITGVDGIANSVYPVRYRNICGCDCDAQIARIYTFSDTGTYISTDNVASGCDPQIVAVAFSGSGGVTDLIYGPYSDMSTFGYGPALATTSSACSWASGPNALISGVKYEFQIPGRLSQGDTKCDTLIPETCDPSTCLDTNVNAGACLDPISWTGTIPENGVALHRRECYPEIMIVNKVECSGGYYKLYVDREYHSHGRDWEEILSVGSPPVATCYPKQKGAYRYETTCISIPFCTPTDSVTPAYHVEQVSGELDQWLYNRGICSTNPSSGTHVTQDFVYGPDPIAVDQDTLWNYFNLFYESGFPSSKYYPAIYLGNPNADPPEAEDPCLDGVVYSSKSIFPTGYFLYPSGRSGIDYTNKYHSCLQDSIECGGDFFCNKMFFPRRNYKIGTKAARFGSLQLCTSNFKFKTGDYYFGYEDFDNTPDILHEIKDANFVDICDTGNYVKTVASIDIDDTYIYVDSYLPLLGISPNLVYRYDLKSCLILGESCASDWVPTHTSQSINQGIHLPKTYSVNSKTSFGYYLDKLTTSESDNCLFVPFKIMVDAECCNSVIRRKYYQNDPPTNLEYIIEDVPSWVCQGFVKQPVCDLGSSTCAGAVGYYTLAPEPVCIELSTLRTAYNEVSGTGVDQLCNDSCAECSPVDCYDADTVYVDAGDAVFAYNPTSLGNFTAQQGVGSADGLIGCGLVCDPSEYRPSTLSDPVFECDGELVIGGTGTINTLAYECGDYYYIPYGGSLPTDSCCTITTTLADTLANCWKIPKDGCKILRISNAAAYLDDWRNCECYDTSPYVSCARSVIKATITEEVI